MCSCLRMWYGTAYRSTRTYAYTASRSGEDSRASKDDSASSSTWFLNMATATSSSTPLDISLARCTCFTEPVPKQGPRAAILFRIEVGSLCQKKAGPVLRKQKRSDGYIKSKRTYVRHVNKWQSSVGKAVAGSGCVNTSLWSSQLN